MSSSEETFCACCEFGDHTMHCVCRDRANKDCCHPQNHFKRNHANRSMVPALAGPHEIAAILGVSAARTFIISRKPDFPKPVARLRCGAVYLVEEIKEYDRTRSKKPGRRSTWKEK